MKVEQIGSRTRISVENLDAEIEVHAVPGTSLHSPGVRVVFEIGRIQTTAWLSVEDAQRIGALFLAAAERL